MDPLKKWLLEQLKAEEPKGQTPRFWRLKDWATRVGMAEFKSVELQYTSPSEFAAYGEKSAYEKLVAPIKDEIKFWEK